MFIITVVFVIDYKELITSEGFFDIVYVVQMYNIILLLIFNISAMCRTAIIC